MRLRLVLLPALTVTTLAMAGCAREERAYAGSSGSTYDAAGNPPQANGTVT